MKLIEKLNYNSYKKYLIQKLIYGLVSEKDLSRVNFESFVIWCSKLISKEGYSNIQIVSTSTLNYIHIKAIKSNLLYAFSCVQCICNEENGKNNNTYASEPLNASYVEEFFGVIRHDNIFNGCILTNNIFNDNAYSYVSSINEKYSLSLFDKYTLLSLQLKFIYSNNLLLNEGAIKKWRMY